MDAPSRSDEFVRGLSEVVGGAQGSHAARRRPDRFWTAARVVLALVCLTLSLHWAQKSPCQDGAWSDYKQYREMCYTDVLALYGSEGLADGQMPYRDHAVEYPVLTGAFMGLIGLPIHAFGVNHPQINQYEWFYLANAIVLCAIAVASCMAIVSMRRRRPWDAALFAASPALLVTATVNWDLLAVGFAVFGIYAWARRRPVLASVLFGLGAAAKLWPGFLLIAVIVLGLRARKFWQSVGYGAIGLATWAVVNFPVMYLYPDSWRKFFDLNSTRPIDWGTLWYVGNHVPFLDKALPGFNTLSANIPLLNRLQYGLFAVCCLAILAVALFAPRRPRFGQVAFLVVAAFLIFSKVWSQQYVLWLLPLAVLARPRWGAFLAWQFAEICYFCAFYGELLGASGKGIFPETVFSLAALLRLISVAVLCGYVIRDILRPERDAVRQTYEDDPEGGIYDGAPDADWIAPLRGRPAEPAEPATVGAPA